MTLKKFKIFVRVPVISGSKIWIRSERSGSSFEGRPTSKLDECGCGCLDFIMWDMLVKAYINWVGLRVNKGNEWGKAKSYLDAGVR